MTSATLAIIALALLLAGAIGALVWALAARARADRAAALAQADAARASSESARATEERATEAARLRSLADDLRRQLDETRTAFTRAEEQLRAADERITERNDLEARFKETFRSLSLDVLKESRSQFLAEAGPVFDKAREDQAALVKPINETLEKTREKLEHIERTRAESFGKITEQIAGMTGANAALTEETGRLARALSRPEMRGQYGEIQLRRVAELAGMVSYCDFSEQTSVRDADGALLRPDMIVKLPNDRVIAVDAKCNTYAYLEAVNAKDDDERKAHLQRFGRHVADQAKKLGDKKYWAQWEGSPEFVVMFVPGDHFVDAALSQRPDLIEHAAANNVILASPSTLIGLLRAVAVGWREARLADEARELFELGRELHERASVAFTHAASLGKAIGASVERYNKLVGSIDSRLVPTLAKFESAGVTSGKPLESPTRVDLPLRTLESAPTDA